MAGVKFSEGAARRIVAATRAYERGNRDQPPVKFRTVSDDGGVRMGQISSTWTKGATATVTELKPDGTTISPTVTFEALNHFATVTVSSGTRKVLCVAAGDLWLLVAAEC